MSNKTKTIIAIITFSILLGGVYVLYKNLSSRYNQDNSGGDIGLAQESRVDSKGKTDSSTQKDKVGGDTQYPKAADFTVVDGTGNKVNLSDFYGKPIVVNMWASWCGPCRDEMPHFDKVYSELGKEVNFLMVDLVDGQRETVERGQAYVDSEGYKFPVYFDTEQKAAFAYMVRSIPTTLFIDSEGYLVKEVQGKIDEADTLRKYIEIIR